MTRLRREMDGFAGATHNVQWMDHLVYKAGGKIFAILGRDTEAGTTSISIKVTPAAFRERTRRAGVTQAPYLAKRMWIRIADIDALAWKDLRAWVQESYELVVAGLPARQRHELDRS